MRVATAPRMEQNHSKRLSRKPPARGGLPCMPHLRCLRSVGTAVPELLTATWPPEVRNSRAWRSMYFGVLTAEAPMVAQNFAIVPQGNLFVTSTPRAAHQLAKSRP